jgi:hypothetical protein
VGQKPEPPDELKRSRPSAPAGKTFSARESQGMLHRLNKVTNIIRELVALIFLKIV